MHFPTRRLVLAARLLFPIIRSRHWNKRAVGQDSENCRKQHVVTSGSCRLRLKTFWSA